jgi:hypothetical protein
VGVAEEDLLLLPQPLDSTTKRMDKTIAYFCIESSPKNISHLFQTYQKYRPGQITSLFSYCEPVGTIWFSLPPVPAEGLLLRSPFFGQLDGALSARSAQQLRSAVRLQTPVYR